MALLRKQNEHDLISLQETIRNIAKSNVTEQELKQAAREEIRLLTKDAGILRNNMLTALSESANLKLEQQSLLQNIAVLQH